MATRTLGNNGSDTKSQNFVRMFAFVLVAVAAASTAGTTPTTPRTIWQITDTHVNLDYPSGCGNCHNGDAGCHKFADYYCGSSPDLYSSAAKFMAANTAPHHSAVDGVHSNNPAFVAHTGDVPDVFNPIKTDQELHKVNNLVRLPRSLLR